ncbi:amidase [Acidocella aminolytica]|uniref:Amidase n=1 Tax=Acidocella aminolytica 101 = DSM 11237 TaxID=1120923 RepID=A0A0D6PFE1_9PROT|nr:amidase [Acidocella aminolytica]GAN79574.1 amidase [Acidocella aminolytica 101 = DSM 11237]GBQ39107.1 amidase [Acidocella aminolytica 101 = DSM 11237]SHF27837.1 aspartyl-tRNA(Asn)/glutamyl-tRNA(Gln) amidotransferase subunit A [Acidocella aminolytica 101 = DSM 11237]
MIETVSSPEALCRLDAASLAEAYKAGRLSPVEVTQACLARAEEINPRLNAFTFIDHEGALAAAKASEARWGRGEPHSDADGIPTTLKDIVWVKDWHVRYGSLTTSDALYEDDAPAVRLLREHGVVFIGQTTMPEFGWKAVTDSPAFGITRNPHDLSKTPGGSSGGAAAAAAAGAGVFHLGTDGGGSIRIPAAFCGISGLKPTFGRVPAYPASAFGTVAHIGPMARSTADVMAMLKIMSGRDLRDWHQCAGILPPLQLTSMALNGLKIGYWRQPPVGQVDTEVASIIDSRIAQLAAAGAEITPFELPGDDLLALFHAHWFTGAAARLAALPEDRLERIDPGLLEIAREGAAMNAIQLVQAQVRRADFGAAMDAALVKHDFILSPGTTIPAFEAGAEQPAESGLKRWTEWAGFSFPINLSQQPAAVTPCGTTKAGLPVAMQVIGARGADSRVLSLAAALEDMFAG